MKWPFVLRSRHEREIGELTVNLDRTAREKDDLRNDLSKARDALDKEKTNNERLVGELSKFFQFRDGPFGAPSRCEVDISTKRYFARDDIQLSVVIPATEYHAAMDFTKAERMHRTSHLREVFARQSADEVRNHVYRLILQKLKEVK